MRQQFIQGTEILCSVFNAGDLIYKEFRRLQAEQYSHVQSEAICQKLGSRGGSVSR